VKALLLPVLAAVVFLDMGIAMAKSFDLEANYRCEAGQVLLKNGDQVINIGLPKIVTYTATGDKLNLVVGDSDYLLWPRINGDRKGLAILKKTQEGMQLIQNIDMGREEVATQQVSMTIERGIPKESLTVTCYVTLSFVDSTF